MTVQAPVGTKTIISKITLQHPDTEWLADKYICEWIDIARLVQSNRYTLKQLTQIRKEMLAIEKDVERLGARLSRLAAVPKTILEWMRENSRPMPPRIPTLLGQTTPGERRQSLDGLIGQLRYLGYHAKLGWFIGMRVEAAPRHSVPVLLLDALAEDFRLLTGKEASRQNRAWSHQRAGKPAGEFWDFAQAVWRAAFGTDKGLSNTFKEWAAPGTAADQIIRQRNRRNLAALFTAMRNPSADMVRKIND